MMEEGETQTPFWIQQTTAAATTTTRRRSLNSGVALFILFLTSFIILSFLLIPPLLSQFSKPTLLFKRSWDSLNITLVLLALLFGFLSRNRNHDFNPTVLSDGRIDSKNEVNKSDETVDNGWYNYSVRKDGIGLSSNRNHIPTDVSFSRNRYHGPTVGFDRTDGKMGNEGNKSVNSGWYEYLDRTDTVGLGRDRNQSPTVDEADRTADIGLRRNQYHDPAVGFDRTDGKIGNEGHKSKESVNSGWYEYLGRTDTVGLGRDRNQNPTVDDDDRAADIGLRRNQYHDPTVGFDRGDDGKVGNKVQKLNEPVNGSWYEYPDPTVVVGLRRSHSSYPDLREVEDSGDRWQFHDDTSLDSYPRSGKSSPDRGLKESVYEDGTVKREVTSVNNGIVLGVGDGIARVSGLDGVTAGEIVEFDEGTIGVVMNPDSTDNVGIVLMGEGLLIREGSCVKATGKIAQEPGSVSEAGLGRVVDALDKDNDGRYGISDPEIKEVPRAVRRRTRRAAGSNGNKGKLSEEVSSMEPPSGKSSHRRTKSSGLELPNERLSHRKTKSSGFERFGTVLLVGKGVARIYGLGEVTEGEIVEFEEGTIGIVSNSESANNVGVVLMGDGLLINEGSPVKATGKIAQIPVTEARLGSVINDLTKPINSKGEIKVSEEIEIEHMPPAVRRRTRRTRGSIVDKEKSMEEVSGSEHPDQSSHRRTKRTYEESKIPKVDAKDQSEVNEYESSPEMLVEDTQSSPPAQSSQSERKKGGGNATRDFLTSLTKRKKKQRQKSVENFDTLLESPPLSPRPSSKGFFSSKKGKNKQVITDPPPLSLYTTSREQKSAPTTAPSAMRRPPLPVNVQNFVEVESPKRKSSFTGAESPLHPIPPPPPPPPFKMSGWKFVMKGDYVNIGSVNSSRSVSPEREEVDSPMGSESGRNDVAMGSMFCPSPDVNSKADMFIAKFREGLKLQKMNSMKMKQGVGLSNLGPVSTLDQAQA